MIKKIFGLGLKKRRRRFGISNLLSAGDRLQIHKRPAIQVFCVRCREHVYYLRSERGGVCPENLTPLPGQPAATDMNCPRCGNPITALLQGEPVLKTNRGYVRC